MVACQRCGRDDGTARVHQRKQRERNPGRPSNTVMLCSACLRYVKNHKTAHTEGWVLWSEDPAGKPCLAAAGCAGTKPENGNYTSMKMFLDDGSVIEDELVPVPLTAAGLPMWTAVG
jgi:hypothetical protein